MTGRQPHDLVFEQYGAAQLPTPSVDEAPVVGTVACQFRFVHQRRRRLWRLASPVGARRTNSAAYQ